MKYLAPLRIRLALDVDEVVAMPAWRWGRAPAGGWPWIRPLAAPLNSRDGIAELRQALGELREALRGRAGGLDLVLLPPLAEVRRTELPRMRRLEMRRVLARDAASHFPAVRGEQIAAAEPVGRARRGRPRPVLAAVAGADLVEAVRRAARDAGWHVRTVAPAHAAWAGSARGLAGTVASRRPGRLLLAHGSAVEVLTLERGRLTGSRRLPLADGTAVAAAALEAWEWSPGALWVALCGGELAAVEEALVAANAPLRRPRHAAALTHSVAVLAARFAPAAVSLVLRSAAEDAAALRRAARRTVLLGATAAALVVAAAGLELWGARRELAAVRSAREAQRPVVARALAVRAAADRLEGRLAAVAAIQAENTSWAAVLSEVADALPGDAYLTKFQGEADSIRVEGVGARAASALESLQDASGLRGMRVVGSIRRETAAQPGSAPLERFVISGRTVALSRPEDR